MAFALDLVVPNLIFGAVLGRVFGLLVNIVKMRLNLTLVDPGMFALLGAASFWAGTSRLLMTIVVASVESSLDLSSLPAIIISVLAASFTARLFGHSIIHSEIHLRNLPYLPYKSPEDLKTLTVNNLMAAPVVCLMENEPRDLVVHLLRTTTHNGFPVIREVTMSNASNGSTLGRYSIPSNSIRTKVVGIIWRTELKCLLDATQESTATFVPLVESGQADATKVGADASLQDSLDNVAKSSSTLNVNRITRRAGTSSHSLKSEAPPAQKNLLLDISSMMTFPAITVNRTMGASKAYTLFRQLRLRHLCVVDDDANLVGIMTRKNFLDVKSSKHDPSMDAHIL